MSGSNSSVRDLPAAAEPLGLTVHAAPLPALGDAAQRTRRGRLRMLLVLLVCAAPVLASYLAYYVLRPALRGNYAALIQPSRTLPALPLRSLAGSPVDAAGLRGQWLLVVAGPAGCAGDCERRLYLQRQLREMLGRDRDRVDKAWFVTDSGPVPDALRAALGDDPALHVLRVPREALAAWLEPEPGRALEDHLYLVDPMGEWMLRAPVQPDPARLKRDLDRLLRAAASWDRAGR
jgi:hypothetical protein